MAWYLNQNDELVDFIKKFSESTLQNYKTPSSRLREDSNREQRILTASGRLISILELIQNGADQIKIANNDDISGFVHIKLSNMCLYCANEGAPIDKNGIESILSSDVSYKNASQIGHFGLGFKSVLAVSDHPQFLSKVISFDFDHPGREEFPSILPNLQTYPRLRLARVIQQPIEDPNLDGLNWATTVVRLPLKNQDLENHLMNEFIGFPREFMLFSPHVKKLTFQANDFSREISWQEQDGQISLQDGTNRSSWRVFSFSVPIGEFSQPARESNIDIKESNDLPLHWAVQVDSYNSKGSFWAFLPTQETLNFGGILNAPWQLGDTRQYLVNGPFNKELIVKAAGHIARHIPELYDPRNPGAVLDLLPPPSIWNHMPRLTDTVPLDTNFARAIYNELNSQKILANWTDEPVLDCGLTLLPSNCACDETCRWVRNKGLDMATYAHPSIQNHPLRREKALAIGAKEKSVADWVHHVAHAAGTELLTRARQAVELAIHLKGKNISTDEFRSAKFILGADEQFHIPNDIFIPTEGIPLPERSSEPHPTLLDREGSIGLRSLGVRTGDAVATLEHLVKEQNINWRAVWPLVDDSEPRTKEIINNIDFSKIQVLNLDQQLIPIRHCFLPGPVVSEDGSRDRYFTLDCAYHQRNLEFIRNTLGISTDPTIRCLRDEFWFPRFLNFQRNQFRNIFQERHNFIINPQNASFNFIDTRGPGPLELLEDQRTSKELRVALSAALVALLGEAVPWEMRYDARPQFLTQHHFENPAIERLLEFGLIPTSSGTPKPPRDCFAPALANWRRLLPVVEMPGQEMNLEKLNLRSDINSLAEPEWRDAWQQMEGLRELTDLNPAIKFVLHAISLGRELPSVLPARVGGILQQVESNRILLSRDSNTMTLLMEMGHPAWLVGDAEDRALLHEHCGMREATVHHEFDPVGPPVPIVTRLVEEQLPDPWAKLRLQACNSLRCRVGGIGEGPTNAMEKDFLLHDDTIYCLETLKPSQWVRLLANATNTPLTSSQIGDLIGKSQRKANRNRAKELFLLEAPNDPERLLSALGEDLLRRNMPPGQQDGTGSELATRAFRYFGDRVLAKFHSELLQRGFHPPMDFRGSPQAMDFCSDLGFSLGLAGEPVRTREAWIEVRRPREMKELHPEYQLPIVEKLVAFLEHWAPGGEGPKRGMMSLPTGSGKTRVAVQAVITAMLKPNWRPGPVVWIAQSDELCEQAVISWTQAWEVLAEPGIPLRISRFWGTTNNGVFRAPRTHHLVVCSIQTLRARLNHPNYSWLKEPSCILIDEAHGAIAPSYTKVLRQMGITPDNTERPLIGFTATPFRGNYQAPETIRLVKRFHSNRFDQSIFPNEDPYAYLQQLNVLAEVNQIELEGHTITLSQEKLKLMEKSGADFLPQEAERELAENLPRTERILMAIQNQPENVPILVFAASVEHACLIADNLTINGRPAAAISGETPSLERKNTIERFQDGELQVLVNYSVLSTGFDAPKVGVIVIARPVFSPVLYQQMIGRGLRGTRNGGTERCLIINVKDNITNYARGWACTEFEHLWAPR